MSEKSIVSLVAKYTRCYHERRERKDADQWKRSVLPAKSQDIDRATLLSNGRVLIHESGNPDGELWTMNTDGSQRTLFSNLRGIGIGFVSRLGTYVIFLTTHNQKTSLIRTDMDGLNPRTVTTGGLWSPYCSSSGDYVYYADWIARPQRLLRVPIEGGAAVEVARVPGKALIGVIAVSPDGKFLAFPYLEGENAAHSKLVVIPADGGPPTETFPDVTGIFRWSPDGSCIVHYAVCNDTFQLVKQPLSGGKPRQLTKFPSGRSGDFSWSPDGKWLYIAHGEVRSDAVLISNFR
ncbi:MAG TPA: hypothetical protein VN780_07755 [Candidatus Eisenbacteria bacterium]|nr:hypothetical protein [Candidatus Eisenbacteria bacterium]